jgi:nucleoside-diphosphate-sugar epimerase
MTRTNESLVVVPGGAGFVGSHLCERLIAAGHHVLVLDDFSTGDADHVAELIAGSAICQRVLRGSSAARQHGRDCCDKQSADKPIRRLRYRTAVRAGLLHPTGASPERSADCAD